MKAHESSEQVHTLNNLLQKALFRSSDLLAEIPREHPARPKAEELHLELQRAASWARKLATDVDALPPAIARVIKAGPSPSPTILVVDDKPEHLELMRTLLERQGYNVLTALDGHDGLEKFLTHKVRLAILDYYMPTLDGGAVALQMRQLRSNIPIVIFSGALTLPDRVMAAIDGFISTSEEPEILLDKVAELVPLEHTIAS